MRRALCSLVRVRAVARGYAGAVGVRAVCWDWNGTLLDDVERCLRIMNSTLTAFGKPVIDDTDGYRALFRFPLQDFYLDAGIRPHEYRPAVDHYLALLARDDSALVLHEGARETIAAVRARGIGQVLASATQAPLLAAQMRPHALDGAFDAILSITDAHAASKRDVIATWLDDAGHAPQDVLLVGDTNHDHEIAEELGTRYVHFTRGHQVLPSRHDVARITALERLIDHLA